MIKKIMFWLEVSRLFSLPMTIFSWVIIFVYSLKLGGNIINGILALIGISAAHLATNLADDYFDYKIMLKNNNMMTHAVKNKCWYIKDGTASLNDVLRVIIIYCLTAFIIGVILTFRSGLDVIWLAVIGGILTLTYSKFSLVGLSELAVGIAFGPLFFEGVFYVMTKSFSAEVFVLSLSVAAFTISVLYAHTLLDYDCDMVSHKQTLCCRIGDKNKALSVLYGFYTLGFLFSVLFSFMTHNYFVLITLLAIPFALNVCNSVKKYFDDKHFIPDVKWWNYPLDNWEKLKSDGTASFYFVLFQSRNLMMIFCVLLLISSII